ncbi:MAG: hypothetical protein ACR2HR_08685 [Euzebya sp.]
MEAMRRSTICRHLREVAETATRLHPLTEGEGGLVEVSVAGDTLGPAERSGSGRALALRRMRSSRR